MQEAEGAPELPRNVFLALANVRKVKLAGVMRRTHEYCTTKSADPSPHSLSLSLFSLSLSLSLSLRVFLLFPFSSRGGYMAVVHKAARPRESPSAAAASAGIPIRGHRELQTLRSYKETPAPTSSAPVPPPSIFLHVRGVRPELGVDGCCGPPKKRAHREALSAPSCHAYAALPSPKTTRRFR